MYTTRRDYETARKAVEDLPSFEIMIESSDQTRLMESKIGLEGFVKEFWSKKACSNLKSIELSTVEPSCEQYGFCDCSDSCVGTCSFSARVLEFC